MIQKKTLVLALIFLSFCMLSADGGLFGWKGAHGTIFHFNIGSQSVDLNSLNEEIASALSVNYPSTFMGVGAQYLYINNNFMLGAEGKHLSNGNYKANPFSSDALYHLKVDGTAGFVDMGYVLYTNNVALIAPWVGVGLGSVNFSLMSDENDWIIAFENLDTATAQYSAYRTVAMMNWGLCMDFIFRTWTIGASLGYMHPISDANWQIAGKEIEVGPETSLTGVYFNLNIGYSKIDLFNSIVN